MIIKKFQEWLRDGRRTPCVMGVLNVTPDSFSDGGRFVGVDAASAQAERMVAEGADLIDVGGESTRPGSQPVASDEQIRRVVPVIRAIAHLPVTISIDTTRADVAEAALDAGAYVVNDISAGRDDAQMFPLVARRQVPVILMHMLGTPATMQVDPKYENVVAEVISFLLLRVAAATSAGIDEARILLDPGIGFGKTVDHNLELLGGIETLAMLEHPVVIGASRKGFIGKLTGQTDPSQRLFGTAATVGWSIAHGASIVRVHDVGPMVEVVKVVRAILTT